MGQRTLEGHGYIYEDSTGLLFSAGSVVADPLPDGYSMVERERVHDARTERWSVTLRDIEPFTDELRAAELEAAAERLTTEAARLRGR